MISGLELTKIEAGTLFTKDENARLRHVYRPEGAAAPSLFPGMTQAGNIWRFDHALTEDMVRRLEALCA
jgi:hypothetical protein